MKIAQHFIIIDDGKLLFQADVEEFDAITRASKDVRAAVSSLNVINEVSFAGFSTAYIFDKRVRVQGNVQLRTVSLHDFFVNLVGRDLV
ncbi:hypothetical protein ACFSTH_18900 [Paenibacillus yanchengensis]|uniref:Uncharacterized protein n=1 Tax=Paenibacillus yanchengensis TaxID=2035833 RepID=A0ABW4YLZ5_9BACL